MLKIWIQRVALIGIIAVAAGLRLFGLDWDAYHLFHPDERYIVWVATTIEWPETATDAFRPNTSTFNPFYWPTVDTTNGIVVPRDQPRDFAYGHLPLYAGVIATRWVERVATQPQTWLPADSFVQRDVLNGAERVEIEHLLLVGRVLTALVDVGSVVLCYFLGKRLFGRTAGLLAAAFLALAVLHIQLAHFFTTDPYTTFFALATILALVGFLDHTRRPWRRGVAFFAASVMLGLAVGSKFSAIMLLLPLALAAWWGADGDGGRDARWDRGRSSQWIIRLALFLGGSAVALLTFAVTNPFALIDFSCEAITAPVALGPLQIPAIDWKSCYLANISAQSAMVRGAAQFPFARQYLGTMPFLYFVEMQLRWGLGWPLGLAAWGGLLWAVVRAGRHLQWRKRLPSGSVQWLWLRPAMRPLWIALAWVLPYWLTTGSFQVKFMRYMQPITPFLLVFAAGWLLHWRPLWRRTAVFGVLFVSALYALSFVSLYREPHPWLTVSAWIYDNARVGSELVVETWDELLPTTLKIDGERLRRTRYTIEQASWLTRTGSRDDAEKLGGNLTRLADADYVIVASNRNYGVLPRLPAVYPVSGQVHQKLFDGSLGYEAVYVAGRGPTLGRWRVQPDSFTWPGLTPPPLVSAYLTAPNQIVAGRADESFTVYDQPLVMVFENVGRLSAETMQAQFDDRAPSD